MPLLQGGIDKETLSILVEEMVENGRFDNESDAMEYCVKFTLRTKYNADI